MNLLHPIINQVQPSAEQQPAVTIRGVDIAMTAGAGTGKTRTLVSRFLALVAEGVPLRRIVAVTFTEKAAREMRNRVREEITKYLSQPALDAAERDRWESAYMTLDAARIGTIHSLCAEILRHHPAEAQIDPRFGVFDEGQAALIRQEVILETLRWMTEDESLLALFTVLGESQLREVVELFIDAQDLLTEWPQTAEGLLALWEEALQKEQKRALKTLLKNDQWQGYKNTLLAIKPLDSGDKAAVQQTNALEAILTQNAAKGLVEQLAALRPLDSINLSGGKQAAWPGGKETLQEVKDALRGLRDLYRESSSILNLALNEQDHLLANIWPPMRRLFMEAQTRYETRKAEADALDFDDLERKVLALLQNDHVAAYWQETVQALLVDEFQDTNGRQLAIVKRLRGDTAGKLFIVGDGKQSIYRFRGAEVSVFRDEQKRIDEGGELLNLSTSYRAHKQLVEQMNGLLRPLMGDQEDPHQPWVEPFAPLNPKRETPKTRVIAPYIELILTVDHADDKGGLERAAHCTIGRLQEMVQKGEIAYGDVAILCRASTSFGAYEDALDARAIPYVTTAGRGFYERPEIRDLLNALRAIATPEDDLALAGLLRSPAIGLTDVALYRLHQARHKRSLWATLRYAGEVLAEEEAQGKRAVQLIGRWHQLADRVPVAELIQSLVHDTHYQTIYLTRGNDRAARNIQKMVTEAHQIGVVHVRDYLTHIENLRSGGARAGEARATRKDAVQLMTIHASKGLEFPVVVIGHVGHDASRGPGLHVNDHLGVMVPLKDENKVEAAVYQLAKAQENAQAEAEANRLLYVAATRAEEKLIFSGYLTGLNKDYTPSKPRGWLKQIAALTGLSDYSLAEFDFEGGSAWAVSCDLPIQITCYEPRHPYITELVQVVQIETAAAVDDKQPFTPTLLQPILKEEEAPQLPENWEVVPLKKRPRMHQHIVGQLVHESLHRWRFGHRPNFKGWLEGHARRLGLVERQEIDAAIKQVRQLLLRLESSPHHAEWQQAEKRRHEVPYTFGNDNGIIDLIYFAKGEWTVVDFKTDAVTADNLANYIRYKKYDEQIQRYGSAVTQLVGVRPLLKLCMLDCDEQVYLYDVPYS